MKDLKVEAVGQVQFWDVASGPRDRVRSKDMDAASVKLLLVATANCSPPAATDNTIKIWDVATQRELRTLTGHTASDRVDRFQS